MTDQNKTAPTKLARQIGLFGATMMGLGSILGTGVFVSIGIAAEVTGSSVLLAICIAAGLATCNALSSAQLAVNYPVSGGTYEYGYRVLNRYFGFVAGWTFLMAKSASAATAALGLAGYIRHVAALEIDTRVIAAAGVLAVTVVVLSGIRRSSLLNSIIVSVTVGSLLVFVFCGLQTWHGLDDRWAKFAGFWNADGLNNDLESDAGWSWHGGLNFAQASALMFVAFTGYGRIATLGEEVKEPERTIPKAIVSTLLFSTGLYVCVAFVSIGAVGADGLAAATATGLAPLQKVATNFHWPLASNLISVAAVTAMLGVLLNLVLGLSRVLLAMARRGDMPASMARVSGRTTTPVAAVLGVACLITGLLLTGSVKTTWSFSAFTVLIYYAITNLAAIRLAPIQRRYPVVISVAGFCGCLGLAFFVPFSVWLFGLAAIGAGVLWKILTSGSAENTRG